MTVNAKIQRAIEYWLEGKGNALLLVELPSLEALWLELSEFERDFRGGDETYGYSSEESIYNSVEYISDRWLTAFRVKWLIDGLHQGKI